MITNSQYQVQHKGLYDQYMASLNWCHTAYDIRPYYIYEPVAVIKGIDNNSHSKINNMYLRVVIKNIPVE